MVDVPAARSLLPPARERLLSRLKLAMRCLIRAQHSLHRHTGCAAILFDGLVAIGSRTMFGSGWHYLVPLVVVVAFVIWLIRDRFWYDDDWWNDSGPDPAPADFRKSKRRRIVGWWQRWP
jgi:hypothetical protein